MEAARLWLVDTCHLQTTAHGITEQGQRVAQGFNDVDAALGATLGGVQ
jgi:hypothetical protein